MHTRFLSSIVVVVIGLTTTVIGGPVFALVLVLLGLAGYREYLDLASRVSLADLGGFTGIGAVSIVGFAVAAYFGGSTDLLFAASAFAIAAPLVALLGSPSGSGAFVAWSLVGSGSAYLGLPVFAAIHLRFRPGAVDAPWLTDLAQRLSFGWSSYPRGLAWVITVVVSTWVSDTLAYLAGRAFGRRKLAPRISPNKTIEGAMCGLLGSSVVGALAFSLFALGNPLVGLAVGGLLGVAGQIGDLAESFLKRQAGAKDSGSLIPGHGGILDRIDALLFAFPAGLLLAAGLDGLQL